MGRFELKRVVAAAIVLCLTPVLGLASGLVLMAVAHMVWIPLELVVNGAAQAEVVPSLLDVPGGAKWHACWTVSAVLTVVWVLGFIASFSNPGDE